MYIKQRKQEFRNTKWTKSLRASTDKTMLCSSVEHLSHEFNRLKKDKFEKVTELTPHFVINQVHQQGISPFKLIESITLLAKKPAHRQSKISVWAEIRNFSLSCFSFQAKCLIWTLFFLISFVFSMNWNLCLKVISTKRNNLQPMHDSFPPFQLCWTDYYK